MPAVIVYWNVDSGYHREFPVATEAEAYDLLSRTIPGLEMTDGEGFPSEGREEFVKDCRRDMVKCFDFKHESVCSVWAVSKRTYDMIQGKGVA